MIPIDIDPKAMDLPAAAPPDVVRVQGANFPLSGLSYDAVNDQAAWVLCRLDGYTGNNLLLDFDWYSLGGSTTGTIVIETQVAAMTPEDDDESIEAKVPAAVNFFQDTNLGGTARRPHRGQVVISNVDGAQAGDTIWVKVARDADSTNATDNMAGNLMVYNMRLTEAP